MPRHRPLTQAERDLLHCFAPEVDLNRVRIHSQDGWLGRMIGWLSRGAAVALGYHIFLPGEPRLPLLAHELTHVTQFAHWGPLRYLAAGAWNQLVLRLLCRRDVYRWHYEPGKPFSAYGMEQQGQIVQECFDAAAPRRNQAALVSPYQPR